LRAFGWRARVDLQDEDRAHRFGGRIDLAAGSNGVAYLDVSGLDGLRRVAAFRSLAPALGRLPEDAGVDAEVDDVGFARVGLDA